jgi:hypothetical protein
MTSVSSRAAAEVLASLGEEIDRIYLTLDPIATRFAALIEAKDRATREDLASLRTTIFTVLAGHPDLIAGAGAFTVPGLLADAQYCLEWWWTRSSGTPEALRVNLDPAAPDFFDYTTDDWYATPMNTSDRHLAGPYVDYACTNQYALTAAVPVRARGELVGIAAADVLMSRLEARILPALCRLAEPVLLVNARGRVVASTSPDFAPGQRIAASAQRNTPSPSSRRGNRSRTFGWQLMSAPATVDDGPRRVDN